MPPREEIDFTRRDSVRDLLVDCNESHEFRMNPQDFEQLRELPGNKFCIDCGNKDPNWASLNLGIFMCLECSGTHRSLGTHVSFVRSVQMDSWSDAQLKKMNAGGNEKCLDFLKQHDILKENTSLKERYDCPAAMLYQQVLNARRDGKPEPTKLPERRQPERTSIRREMQGFGSPPPPKKSPVLVTNTLSFIKRISTRSQQVLDDSMMNLSKHGLLRPKVYSEGEENEQKEEKDDEENDTVTEKDEEPVKGEEQQQNAVEATADN